MIDDDDEEEEPDPTRPRVDAFSSMPLAGVLSTGYRKLGMLVEHLETRTWEMQVMGGGHRVTADWVLREIDKFAQGLGKWLKVAGDDKAEILQHSIGSRPLTEHKTMVEFGSFVGYTATRMGRAVERTYEAGYADGSILFEDSRLQGANRITSMEIDPVHACIARHVLDMSRLSHIVEVWIGQVKDLIPRLTEEHGDMSLNMVFMDQRGTTFHDDLSQLEELNLMFPNCRIVADNCVKPGSPVYCWHTTVSERYKTTNYSLNEFLESTIEDWQVVCDYLGPLAGRQQAEREALARRGKGNKARVGNAAAEEQGEIHLASHKAQRTLTANVRSVLREAMKLDRVCAVLGDKEAEAILSAMEFFEFLPGEAVVEQGTTGNTFFIAQTGSLQVSVNGNVCNTVSEGQAFGSLALLYNCPRTATVKALTRCGVWGANGASVHAALRENAHTHQQDYRQFLDSIRLFDGLTDSQKEKAAESAFKEVFETGARLVTAGEDFAAIYFVKKGELRVMRGGKVMADGTFVDGQVLATLGPGTSLGEALLSGGNARWENTVVASSSSEVLCISVPELKSLLGEDLGRVLENSLVLKAMQESAVLSQFSSGQRSEISKWITVRTYAVGAKVEDHAGFLVVLKGQIKGKWQGEAKTREQGDWLEEVSDLAKKMLMVRKVRIFQHLSREQVSKLVRSFVLQRHRKGAQVIKQGEVGSSFFVIVSGEVNVTIDGKFIRVMSKNSYIGERALLFDEPRTATVEVVSSEAEFWSIEKHTFTQIVKGKMQAELMHRIRLQDSSFGLKDLSQVSVIGAGAAGVVRLVINKSTGTRYALKRIRKQGGKVPEEVNRECGLLKGLDHPFIMALVKTFETDRSVYILTELITGGELHGAIREIPTVLSRAQAQFYTGSLVIVLEELSEQRIVYRDLKPENVMLDSQGYLKLIDFGIAKKMAEGETRTFTMIGTPHYMAPEVMRGHGYGTEADLWSLGIMLFEFVCGYLPYADELDDPTEVCTSVLKDPLVFPQRFKDAAARTLIQGLLNRQQKKRLGVGFRSWEDIKSADFFTLGHDEVSLFDKILGRDLDPPVHPHGETYCDPSELNVTLSDDDELG
ncbi:egl-4 [Symbiodinium sp. KB8]|nr:egl-4 [Symbiodinium sp. KB8]